MKIKKILIANRGEIALRVIKTCKDMGIKTVTIYSEEDKELPHSYKSDEAISLGEGTLADTYLNIDKIIEIAKRTDCDAIHPGYGFLSENTQFAQALSSKDIIFIGPSVNAIELMGDKKTSKVKMEEIGVPLIPGYHGEDQTPDVLEKEADKIGYPVLIKATAGGGGKGMKIVNEKSDFISSLESAKREASNAFGNDKVLLEKYIVNPRHIEVQLVSDGQGNHFHFFERECSIQRRYQKVIEETPSVALDDKLREDICNSALQIARGIDYIGAGTIEFILSSDNKYYFLEMNTRLQVEHPVTEMVTGFDLVKLQIQAAQGEAFPFTQKDIKQTGHSFECRVYAEDPDNDFLPTNGRIKTIGSSKVARLDSGFRDGNNISTNYDPMLAKVIVHASSRTKALAKMINALNEITFSGAKTNRDYMKRVLRHEKFINGDFHTHFLTEFKDELAPRDFSDYENAKIIATLILKDKKVNNSWNKLFNFRNV